MLDDKISSDSTPLNLPSIRTWEIDENSTHYDKMIAAPSDEEMKLMWIFWSLIMGMVALFSGIVFIAILLDKKARKNPFNVYLLCLMVPDILMSFLCWITCWVNAATGHFYSEASCYFQSFYFIFGIGANSWLNAIIARQLYLMLDGARHFRRYQPPTRKRVILDALKVYAFATFVACWGLIDQPWWPHKTGLVLGTACVPIDYDTISTIFFYCVFFPALMGLPMGYVLYVLWMIRKHDLMPPSGKRRLLALYFFRLAAVFVVMWLPALLFLFILGAWVNHWIVWAGGAWSHLQGLVSTALSLMKPDIGGATRAFVTCQVFDIENDEEGAHLKRRRSSWLPRGTISRKHPSAISTTQHPTTTHDMQQEEEESKALPIGSDDAQKQQQKAHGCQPEHSSSTEYDEESSETTRRVCRVSMAGEIHDHAEMRENPHEEQLLPTVDPNTHEKTSHGYSPASSCDLQGADTTKDCDLHIEQKCRDEN